MPGTEASETGAWENRGIFPAGAPRAHLTLPESTAFPGEIGASRIFFQDTKDARPITMKRTIFAIMMSYTFVIGFLIIGTFLITGMLSQGLNDGNLWNTCPLMWINPCMLMFFAFAPDNTPNATLFAVYGMLSYLMLTLMMLWRMIVGFRQVVVEA